MKNNKKPNRNKLILEIIKTDSSFFLYTFKDGTRCWVGKCIHCDSMMTININGSTHFAIEHINPRYQGSIDNLALSCGGCNYKKEIKYDDEYVGKNMKSSKVIKNLEEKRKNRWRIEE